MASDPQQAIPDIVDVYDRFMALTEQSAELGGSLLVHTGFDWRGTALAIASNVAGAASLGIEPELARAKAAVRNGACDFLVNTLDEALRILKNEIRKKNPVAVVLVGDPPGVLAEMVKRGVQPEVVEGGIPGMDTLVERGARRLEPAAGWGAAVSWRVEREAQRSLPVVDRLAAEALDPADKSTAARRRWLKAAPRYLGRALAGQRYVRMSEAEWDRFVAAIQGDRISVTVKRDGVETVIAPDI